ncbi:hypothetical protein [Streptomyces microflavus]|uniref:hypothetical protein n=1 Tax=Streptomyces microflavus TaxID=1919 RepID=UPI0036B93FE9
MDKLADDRLAASGGESGVELAVVVLGPRGLNNARKLHLELNHVENLIAAVGDTDCLLHLTEWHQPSTIDSKWLAARATALKVIDARGTLSTDKWRETG